MSVTQRISTFLWFNDNAEEAVTFYTSIFKNSKVISVTRNPGGPPGPVGAVLVIAFQLDGQQLVALNGGPIFKFTEAISLVVNCDTQEEVDYFGRILSEVAKRANARG